MIKEDARKLINYKRNLAAVAGKRRDFWRRAFFKLLKPRPIKAK